MPLLVHASIPSTMQWLFTKRFPNTAFLLCRPNTDSVTLSNTLAAALNRAFGAEVFGRGMPWSYNLSLLETFATLLEPITLVVFQAHLIPELLEDLLKSPIKLILHYPPEIKPPAELSELNLTITLSSKPTPATERKGFSKQAAQMRLQSHLERKDWGSALETLTTQLPEKLEEHLEQAAWELLGEGRCERLLELLTNIQWSKVNKVEGRRSKVESQTTVFPTPSPSLRAQILRFQLIGSIELWQHEQFIAEVETFLQQYPTLDPNLRAYYALALYHVADNQEALAQLEQALTQSRTVHTLHVAGTLYQYQDLNAAQSYLSQALKRAEASGHTLLQAQIAVALSECSMQALQPKRSLDWADWVIRKMSQANLNLIPLRLKAFNLSTTARLYMGDTVGLEAQLRREAECLEKANPRMRNIIEWTLAELLCHQGQIEEAQTLMANLWSRLKQRESMTMYALSYVQILLEQDRYHEAQQIAEQTYSLNETAHPIYSAKARLAHLVVQGWRSPSSVVDELRSLTEFFANQQCGYELLLTQLHLVRALLACEQDAEAELLLQRIEPALRRFGPGLAAMVGPTNAFKPIFMRFDSKGDDLELEFLGAAKARLLGFPLSLRQRQADVLATLALNSEGQTVEQLALALYGEQGIPETARSELKRTRKLVPISQSPHKLEVGYKADFLAVKKYIAQGDLRSALNLYGGALLPNSKAPLIEQERMILQETLREAALKSHDIEAILAVAELSKDDLELWEQALSHLSMIDPRWAMAQARRRQVERDWDIN